MFNARGRRFPRARRGRPLEPRDPRRDGRGRRPSGRTGVRHGTRRPLSLFRLRPTEGARHAEMGLHLPDHRHHRRHFRLHRRRARVRDHRAVAVRHLPRCCSSAPSPSGCGSVTNSSPDRALVANGCRAWAPLPTPVARRVTAATTSGRTLHCDAAELSLWECARRAAYDPGPHMTAKLLDGKAIARDIRDKIKARVAALRARTGVQPSLAVILVGLNPASRLYVRNKVKACAEVGIRSVLHEFPADIDAAAVIARIEALNRDPAGARRPGAAAAARAPRYPLRAAHDRGGEGRRRLPSLQCRRAGARRHGIPALHALRRHEAARFSRHRRRRQERHRRRRQQHRRQADGADADAARGDGRDLSRQDARPRPVHHPRRHPGRRRRRCPT